MACRFRSRFGVSCFKLVLFESLAPNVHILLSRRMTRCVFSTPISRERINCTPSSVLPLFKLFAPFRAFAALHAAVSAQLSPIDGAVWFELFEGVATSCLYCLGTLSRLNYISGLCHFQTITLVEYQIPRAHTFEGAQNIVSIYGS